MQKSIYSQNYLHFLELLIETRKNAGLTQEQLALKLQQTQSFVSKCERGERRLDLIETREFLIAIGADFGKFIQELNRRIKD